MDLLGEQSSYFFALVAAECMIKKRQTETHDGPSKEARKDQFFFHLKINKNEFFWKHLEKDNHLNKHSKCLKSGLSEIKLRRLDQIGLKFWTKSESNWFLIKIFDLNLLSQSVHIVTTKLIKIDHFRSIELKNEQKEIRNWSIKSKIKK